MPSAQPLCPMVTVRRAIPADIPALTRNILAMARESEGRTLDENILSAGIRRLFDEPALGAYWVALNDLNCIASCLITIEWSDWNNAPYWWFQSVYVHPDCRGKGIFARIMTDIEAEARKNGACELRLYVETGNTRAIRAYKKCAFTGGHYAVMEKCL